MNDDGCKDPRCPNRRTILYAEVLAFAATVIAIGIIVALVGLLLTGCATHKPAPAPPPQYAGVTRAAQSLGGTLSAASDSGRVALDRNADARQIADFIEAKTLELLSR